MNEAQERFTETDYFGTCIDSWCDKPADPAYGDLCSGHGKGRAWIRRALSREPMGDHTQVAPSIVDDTCLPSRPCMTCQRCLAAMDGTSA